jgi:hypothetical protein
LKAREEGVLGADRVRTDRAFFFCGAAPDCWSQAEVSQFLTELRFANDFLSQLASPESATPDRRDDDSERHLQLARERRTQLLSGEEWVDAPTVHGRQGGNPASHEINHTASALRRRGELLGAWNGREFLHPAFQFRPETGRLMPEVKALLEILPKDHGGWRQAFWVFQAHGQLDGARPADVFGKDPHSVISAARSDFGAGDEHW